MTSAIELFGDTPYEAKKVETQTYEFVPSERAKPYLADVSNTETKYGIPQNLLARLIDQESKFDPNAKSEKGAIGIAQIVPKWHPDVDPNDSIASIEYSGKYLKQMYDRFGSWDKALAAYNTGPGNLDLYGMDNLPKETKDYIKKITGREIQPEKVFKSAKELFDIKPSQSTVPTTEAPLPIETVYTPDTIKLPFTGTIPVAMTPKSSAFMSKYGFGPRPEGGYDEFLRPLNKDGELYFNPDKATGVIAETLSSLSGLASQPMEVVRGLVHFGLNIPGMMTSLLMAAGSVGSEVINDAAFGTLFSDVSMNDLYNLFSKKLQENSEYFDPKILTGTQTKESQLVEQSIMAPLTILSSISKQVADSKSFENYPNVQGTLKFSGDIGGFLLTGYLLHGKSSINEVTKNVESVVKESADVAKAEKIIENTPDATVKGIQKLAINKRKAAIEQQAKGIAKEINDHLAIRKDSGKQVEKVIEAKNISKSESTPSELKGLKEEAKPTHEYTSKKGNKYTKVGNDWLDDKGNVIDNQFKLKALEKNKSKIKPKEELSVEQIIREETELEDLAKIKAIEDKFGRPIDQVSDSEIEKFVLGEDEVTFYDEMAGEDLPQLKDERSPYFQTPEEANAKKLIFEERNKAVSESPEMFTQKLINDVNRWYHGEDLPIDTIRESLSNLASKGEELRGEFINSQDHLFWKENVSEAANWARNLERESIKEGRKKSTGVILRSGILPSDVVKGAKKVMDYTNNALGVKKFNFITGLKLAKEGFVNAFIDRSGNLRKELIKNLGDTGYRILQSMYLSRGGAAWAADMLHQMRKEVYAGRSNLVKRIQDTVILSKRMEDIASYKTETQFTFPNGLSPEEFKKFSKNYMYKSVNGVRDLTDYEINQIESGTAAYYDWMKTPLKDLLKENLISPEAFERLISHNYRKLTKVEDIYDTVYKSKIGDKVVNVRDSGIDKLSKGQETDIYEPSSEIMAMEVFNRSYNRIMNNRANRQLYDLADSDPNNPYVKIKKSKSTPIPEGWSKLFTYVDGKRKTIYLNPKVADEWITNNPDMTYRFSNLIRYASGAPLLKTFATGINIGFAISNIPRDIAHAWFSSRVYNNGKWTSVYSSFMPKAIAEFGYDASSVFLDTLLRKGKYNDYVKEGGGLETLTSQGRLFQRGKHIESNIDKVYNIMGYLGETSELMTRLMIRERAIKRIAKSKGITYEQALMDKEITREATFAARDQMDFSQGGWASKGIDTVVPYFNASIQGTRGLWRAFKDNPSESSYKLAQFSALVIGLHLAMKQLHPKSSKDLYGNPNAQNNIIIPIGDSFGYEDEEGQTRYPFFKLPVDPSQRFFKTLFEALADKWVGDPIDVESVIGSLKQFSPVGITDILPPSISAVVGYSMNKDFWTNKDIWTKGDKPFSYKLPKILTGDKKGGSEEEYIPNDTPQFFTDVGKFTGLSPERLRYSAGRLFSSGTIWSYLLGKGYDEAFSGLSKYEKEQHLADVLAKTPLFKRVFGVTHPYSKYKMEIDKAEESVAIDRWMQNRITDLNIDGYLYGKGVSKKDVDRTMMGFKDYEVYKRLKSRFEFKEKTKELPNKSFWLRMKDLNTEARAKVYIEELSKMSPEEKKQFFIEEERVSQIGGVITPEFRNKVMELLRSKE